MGQSKLKSNKPLVLTDLQKRYEAETGSTMFSSPANKNNGKGLGSKSQNKQDWAKWRDSVTGMDAGKNRFNEMMANRSQNPVLGQTQAGMSGFDKFQAMQAARNSANSTYGQRLGMEVLSEAMAAKGDPEGIWLKATQNYRNRNSGQQPGYDRFQAQMGANPLILQQLQQQQMGQRQMGPQFNAFGFGAQPGLNAQGGQGGSMLANMSSQGMNQLAAGQQNNPTIFKAKS